MRRLLFASLSGALFTLGLAVGGMTDPRKVRGFLDFTGAWDASLAFVMMGAIGVYALIHRWSQGREQPWYGSEFILPARRSIDVRLVAGAALFGVGWGLSGLCPGPAWSALGTGSTGVLVFVLAMLAGMLLVRALESHQATRAARLARLPPATAARNG